MVPFVAGFSDELEKLGGNLGLALTRLQMEAAQKLLGVDPRTPTPFTESRLDDAVSKMRLQQKLIEMNRRMMGLQDTESEKTGSMRWMSPRLANRVVQGAGYDPNDPGFQNIARQITGTGHISHMTQPQLKTLVTVLTGTAI